MLADKLFSVGLTGGIGSGKSLVADMLGERGATIIDTDQIAHQLTVPAGLAIAPIEAAFGPEFLTAEGALDRARMREHVFTDPAARKRLEAILHPLIRVETERATQNARGVYAVYVVPLLIESGSWKNRVDRVLVVDCPESAQIARVMARNGLPEAQVRAIMAAQASRSDRLAAADDVIINDGDKAALGPLIEKLHARYLSLANGNSVK